MIYVFFHLATQVWSWLSPSRKPIKLRNHVSTLWIVFCLSWDYCEGAGDVGLPVLPLVVCVSKLIILFFCYPLPKVTTCIELVNSFLCPPFIFSELASASSLHVSERFCSKFFWTRVFVRNSQISLKQNRRVDFRQILKGTQTIISLLNSDKMLVSKHTILTLSILYQQLSSPWISSEFHLFSSLV